MRALLQRVTEASVTVAGQPPAAIGNGLLILLGVGRQDSEAEAVALATRCARLRLFEDEQGKMNRSLIETRGAALVVSQFTLCADTERGLRPSFDPAARPELARPLYERFVRELRALNVETRTGEFGAHMKVRLENDGPVTIMLESPCRARKEQP